MPITQSTINVLAVLREQSSRRLQYVSALLRDSPEISEVKNLSKKKLAKYLDHLIVQRQLKRAGHKEASHSSKRARIEAIQDPGVRFVVECRVLLANRCLTRIHNSPVF